MPKTRVPNRAAIRLAIGLERDSESRRRQDASYGRKRDNVCVKRPCLHPARPSARRGPARRYVRTIAAGHVGDGLGAVRCAARAFYGRRGGRSPGGAFLRSRESFPSPVDMLCMRAHSMSAFADILSATSALGPPPALLLVVAAAGCRFSGRKIKVN